MPTENITDWKKELIEQYYEPHRSTSEADARKDHNDKKYEENDDDSKEKPCPLECSDALSLQVNSIGEQKTVEKWSKASKP